MTMNVIAKTAVMREREFATQVLSPQHLNPDHARTGIGNVTTVNVFRDHGSKTMNVIATTALMRKREFATQISAKMGNGNATAVNALLNLGNAMDIGIVQTIVMRRDVPIQAYARITNFDVTTANAFEKRGMTTKNVIAKMAVMSQKCNVMCKLKLSN